MRIYISLLSQYPYQGITGIGQYVLNLLNGMKKTGHLSQVTLIVEESSANKFRSLYPETETIAVQIPGWVLSIPWKEVFFRRLWLDRVALPRTMRRKQGILFQPYQAVTAWISRRHPTVMTVHDLYFQDYPDTMSPLMLSLTRWSHWRFIRSCTRVITPSEYVRDQIRKTYPQIPPKRIQAIHNPIVVHAGEQERLEVPELFILSVNALRVHKNLVTLIRAFNRINGVIPHSLVLTGPGDPLGEEQIRECLEEVGENKVVTTGYLTDAQRNYLYQQADLFVSPSMYEGFGMTPVEAALFGTDVLTTTMTSLPEVTRGLLHSYEPADDPQALAQAILKCLEEPRSEEQRQEIAREFRTAYEPEAVAEEYFELFREVWRECK